MRESYKEKNIDVLSTFDNPGIVIVTGWKETIKSVKVKERDSDDKEIEKETKQISHETHIEILGTDDEIHYHDVIQNNKPELFKSKKFI